MTVFKIIFGSRSRILEMLGKAAIQKNGIQYSRPIYEQYSAGGNNDRGNCPCINFKALNILTKYKQLKVEGFYC